MKREIVNIGINLFSKHSPDVTVCRNIKQVMVCIFEEFVLGKTEEEKKKSINTIKCDKYCDSDKHRMTWFYGVGVPNQDLGNWSQGSFWKQ